MEEYLQVGIVTSTHGVKGEVKVFPTTDDPLRFKRLKQVIVQTPGENRVCKLSGVRFFKNMVIVKLGGVDTMNDAELLRNCPLLIPRKDAVPLREGEYFLCDMIGMEVITDTEQLLGKVTEIIRTGANDVYVVEMKDKKEVLIPNIKECILNVSVNEKRMKVHLLEGLMD